MILLTAQLRYLSGTGFTEAEMGQVDVLEQLDWSKLRWNIDEMMSLRMM